MLRENEINTRVLLREHTDKEQLKQKKKNREIYTFYYLRRVILSLDSKYRADRGIRNS